MFASSLRSKRWPRRRFPSRFLCEPTLHSITSRWLFWNMSTCICTCTDAHAHSYAHAHMHLYVCTDARVYAACSLTNDTFKSPASASEVFRITWRAWEDLGCRYYLYCLHEWHLSFFPALFVFSRWTFSFANIRSTKHNVFTVMQSKKALTHFDSKRWIFSCGIHSVSYGHYHVRKYFNLCPICKPVI